MVKSVDVLILGAGASGLMAAWRAGQLGKSVAVIDHGQRAGAKILISGGGRCNFTNLHCGKNSYLSQNPSFCLSALHAFTPQDFLAFVKKHAIGYHEKKLGQLFCDDSARAIVDGLVAECRAVHAEFYFEQSVISVTRNEFFEVVTSDHTFQSRSLIVATGGLACPKMGASDLGYRLATQFGLPIIAPYPALVPFVFKDDDLSLMRDLSGISLCVSVSCEKARFVDDILFTHHGLSGPAILQISSFWKKGKNICINFLPDMDLATYLKEAKLTRPKAEVKTVLSSLLPQRLAHALCARLSLSSTMADISHKTLDKLVMLTQSWCITPYDTEGYHKAEVTGGGIDTRALSSKTMQATTDAHLFFAGEVIDVTGWLGGYNLQWAWSSGFVAGTYA